MKAKPFIKWVGGKGQLIQQLEELLPPMLSQWENVTYIEPFVGGGAMLFHMLQTYPNITTAVINDINSDLTTCYLVVRDHPIELIKSLEQIQKQYYALTSDESRLDFYLERRTEYNSRENDAIFNTTLFFFLNRTCFNGLYRVNKSGLYNVPFGKYTSPQICDEHTILEDSRLLQRVQILTGDYQNTISMAKGQTLFYFDPPYRPLNATSSFNDYTKEAFNDAAQVRLRDFCNRVHDAGHYFMLSNSDCADRFFDQLYHNYHIHRVLASRNVNANPNKRGKLTELLIRNFE